MKQRKHICGLNLSITFSFNYVSYTTRAEPLSFRAIKDLAPQKRRLSGLHSDNHHFGVPAGKMSDRKNPTPDFPTDRTVQWEMAKSLIARKDRGTARVAVGVTQIAAGQ